MIRVLFAFLLPALVPMLMYFAWRALQKPGEAGADDDPAKAPWAWLVGLGVLAGFVTLLVFMVNDPAGPFSSSIVSDPPRRGSGPP